MSLIAIVAVPAVGGRGIAEILEYRPLPALALRTAKRLHPFELRQGQVVTLLELVEIQLQLFEWQVLAAHVDGPAAKWRDVIEHIQPLQLTQRASDRCRVELRAGEQLLRLEIDHVVTARTDDILDLLQHAALCAGLGGQQVDERGEVGVEPNGGHVALGFEPLQDAGLFQKPLTSPDPFSSQRKS